MSVTLRMLCLVLLMCGWSQPAWAQWTNEPPGSTVVVDCPMVSPASCGLVDVYGSLYSTSESASNMVSPPSVQNSRLTAGQSSGGSQVEKGLGAVARDIYLGITMKTNSPFPSFACCANKMTFLRGPSTNGFFGLHKDSGAAQIYFGHNTGLVNGVQLDNSHVCQGDFGLLGCMQNVNSLPIVHGAWHKLEIYMRSSTTATSRDGILWVWNNGVQIMDYRTLNYPGGFNEWVWTETYGGPTAPTDRIWSIDHVRISLPNCQSGCGGGLTPPAPPPPPPLPPNKPTNLRVR